MTLYHNKMATGSLSDEWMYNEVLDEDLHSDGLGGEATRRISVDSTDLLDDVLTFPSTIIPKEEQQDDAELNFVQESENGVVSMEESASARFNAEQMAKTVQSRIITNKTSMSSFENSDVKTIFSRDPNKKNSVFIGNITWWTTDADLVQTVKDCGLGAVKMIKFIENKTNGQSKGIVIVELANEALALGAPDKLQQITLYDKKLVAAYAGRMSVQQFEAKCQGKPIQIERKNVTKSNHNHIKPPLTMSSGGVPTVPFRPPPMGGFPSIPPFGLRPPGMMDHTAALLQHSFPPMMNAMSRMPSLPPPPMPPVSAHFGAGSINKPPTAPHLNPAFLQDLNSQGSNVAELFAKAGAHFQTQAHSNSGILGGKPSVSDEETAETNQRNRAISSSAITRAMSDANSGDYESAVDILRMAITLIKQSVTAGSESNQMLIQSLQDCLHGIEQQASVSSGTKRNKSHERSHDNSHDRDRNSNRSHHSNSSKHYRDRSRERRR